MMDDYSAKIIFKTSKAQEARIKALAKKEMLSLSAMMRILTREALNDREAQAMIRAADQAKRDAIDMRFCSPHCRHLAGGRCYCTKVTGTAISFAYLNKRISPLGHWRHPNCPYTAGDFERWQQYTDEDVAAIAEQAE